MMANKGLFNKALRLSYANRINDWISRLRVCLCDHLCFVVEDSLLDDHLVKFPPYPPSPYDPPSSNNNNNNKGADEWCNCQPNTSYNIYPPSFTSSSSSSSFSTSPSKIVACVVTHDLASRVSTLSPPPSLHIGRSVRAFLSALGKRRVERIREDENLLLTEEIRERQEKEEKDKKEGVAPKISKEIPHHLGKERDHKRDNEKTIPKSGEGLELWILATRPSHAGFKIASFVSEFVLEYVKRETKYKFITLDAAHPATEKIWRGESIRARVMSRMKTREFEYEDENGKMICPLSTLNYDMCCLDVDIKRP